MAENTALALLSNQQQQSAQVFGQIMGAMNAVQQTTQQTAQMTFAVAAKEGQMREEARMNDARIAGINFQNSYLAAKHNAEMEILPLKMENERMQLEAAKLNQKNALLKSQYEIFNSVVTPFKTAVAANFSENQDPAYAQGYMDIEAKWRGQIANGGQFDNNAYKAEVDDLNRKFEGSTPKPGYNPQVSFYLGAMGATSEKTRYDAKNPAFAPNITGIKSAIITGSEENFAKAFAPGSTISESFTQDEAGRLGNANRVYSFLESSAKAQQEIVARAYQAMATIPADKYPEQAAQAKLSFDLAQSTLTDLNQQKKAVYDSAMKGEDIREDQYKAAPPLPPGYEGLGKAFEQLAAPGTTFSTGADFGEKDSALINQQANKTPQVTARFPEATQGIDFSVYRGVDIADNPEKREDLRRKVLRNLEGETLSSMKSLFSRGTTDKAFENLFQDLNQKPVSVAGAFGYSDFNTEGGYNQPGFDRLGMIVGKRTKMQSLSRVSQEELPFTSFETTQDILEYVEKFEGTDNQRLHFLKDVYSGLVTADLINPNRK